MSIVNTVRKFLMGKTAEVHVHHPQEVKDNTPVNRRINRMIRIKRSLETLRDKAKIEQLQKELDEHLAELKANSVALQFLQDLDKNK
jgi:hypothetical protein